MKRLLTLLLVVISVNVFGQKLSAPTGVTPLTQYSFYAKTSDSTLHAYSGSTWLWWKILSKKQGDALYQPIGVPSPLTYSLSTGYGLSGTSFNGSANISWTADTTSATGLVSKSRLATNLTGYVPKTTTLTINGSTRDLSTNRIWNVGTVLSVGATAGTGISIAGTSPITSSGTYTITNTAPELFINVKDYGAVGNGVTNDRTAIRAALTAAGSGNTVYFPNGTYLADSLLIPEGVKLLGASSSTSKLKIVTGSSYLVKLDGENVVDNLYFLGSNPTEVYVQADAVGTERAIIIDDVSDTDNFIIQNSIIVGFDNVAIYANNVGANNNYYGAGLKISNIITEFNYYGLFLDDNAQYVQVANSIFLKSHTGAAVKGGNNQFANCGFNGGVNGFKLLEGGNDGHGAITNTTFNHNSGFALLIDSVLLGQKISNIHVYEGVVQVNRSKGIQFTNSHFEADTLKLGKSQAGSLTNSTFINSIAMVRNVGGDDGFYLNGNRYTDTTGNSVALFYGYINDPVRLYAQTLGAKTPGTAGQVLVSTGSSIAPVWSSTPTLTNYLPLSGGTLTGDLAGTNIGASSTLSAVTLNVTGLQTNLSANSAADALRYNQIIAATNAYNSNPEAGTLYQVKFNAAGDLVNAGGVSVYKENGTDGNFATAMGFHTRANGGDIIENATLSSGGNLSVVGNISAANFDANTYTPTLTNGTNVSASSVNGDFHYIRIKNQVTVEGSVVINFSGAGNTVFDVSLPIASNFSGQYQLNGSGINNAPSIAGSAICRADTTNDRMSMNFAALSANGLEYVIRFTYTIL